MESIIGGGKADTEIFDRDYYWINNENDKYSLGSFDFFNKYVFVDDVKGGGFFNSMFDQSNRTSESAFLSGGQVNPPGVPLLLHGNSTVPSLINNPNQAPKNDVKEAVVNKDVAVPVQVKSQEFANNTPLIEKGEDLKGENTNASERIKAPEGIVKAPAKKVNTSGKKTNKTIFNYGTESQNKAWKNLIIDLLAMSFHTSGNKSGYFGDIKLTEPENPEKGTNGYPYSDIITYYHYEWLDPPSRLIEKKSNEKDTVLLNYLQKEIYDKANEPNEAGGESNFKGLTKEILSFMIKKYRESVQKIHIDSEKGVKDFRAKIPCNNVESKTINMSLVEKRRKDCDSNKRLYCDSRSPDYLHLFHNVEPTNMGIVNDLGERMQKTLPKKGKLKMEQQSKENLQKEFFPDSINDEYFENMPEEVIENTNIFLSLLEIEFILRTERVNANELAYMFEKDKYRVLSEEQIERNKKYGYKNEANIDDFFNNAAKKLHKRIKRDYYLLPNKNVDLEQKLLSKWDGKNYYKKSSKDISFKNIYADNEDDINKFKNALQEGKGSIICLQIEKIQEYLQKLQGSKIINITFKADKMEDKTLFVRKICESLIEKANKIIKKFDEKDPSIKKLENLKTECNIKFGMEEPKGGTKNKGGKKRVTRRKSIKKREKKRKTKRKSRK
jgi:hypothetical protein